jgi:hypothetical protein
MCRHMLPKQPLTIKGRFTGSTADVTHVMRTIVPAVGPFPIGRSEILLPTNSNHAGRPYWVGSSCAPFVRTADTLKIYFGAFEKVP